MPFVPLALEEVLDVILPQLVFPCWNYQPELPADRQLGETIWHKVNPSLRNLATLLATASQMATDEQIASITGDLIDEAYVWMMTQQEQYYTDTPPPSAETEAKGPHEDASEERHKAKEKTRES